MVTTVDYYIQEVTKVKFLINAKKWSFDVSLCWRTEQISH